MPKLICGPAGCGKTRALYGEIASLAKEGKKSILIVPENMSHSAERRLLEVCGNSVSRFACVATFTSLTNRLLSADADTSPSLDGGGRVLSMFLALTEAGSRLTYYKGALVRPRLVSSMLDTVSELIYSGVTPEEFFNIVSSPDMSDKLRDIAEIYNAYFTICRKSSLDPASLLDRAKEHIHKTGIFKGVHIFIDDFSGFSGQKYSFLSRVFEECADMTAAVLLGDGVIFSEQQKTCELLKSMGERAGRPFEVLNLPPRGGKKPPELSLCERVFEPKSQTFSGEPSSLFVYSAANPSEECELCAALIRDKTVNGNARLRDIAVVSGNPDEYSGLLESSFIKYDIPAFFSQKENVLKKPLTEAVLGALNVLRENYSERSVISYLKTGFVSLSDEEIYLLENYALMWNVHGKAWLSPFYKSTVGYLRRPDDEKERLSRLDDIRKRALKPVTELKSALSGCVSGADYSKAFLSFLQNSGLSLRIDERKKELEEAGMREEAFEHARLFDSIKAALSQLGGVLGELPLNPDEFYELLVLTLSQYEVGVIPQSLDSVTVSSFTSLAPEGVRHLFILGARDGLLPPDLPQKSILSDAERDTLLQNGVNLSMDTDKALELQSDIYRALSSPDISLSFSFPSTLSDGSECVESYILSRVKKIFPDIKTQSAPELLKYLRLSAKKPLFEQACASLSSADPEKRAAFCALKDKEEAFLKYLKERVETREDRVRDPFVIKKVFENGLYLSPTSVENISDCRFKYFCKSVLRLSPRQEYEFKMTQLGTLAHEVAEKGVRELCEKGGDPKRIARRLCNEFVEKNMPDADSPRQKAILARFFESVEIVLSDIWDEIENSDFKPKYFELRFKEGGEAPPLIWEDGGFKCVLSGAADRVDFWNNYIKVVDYKTGNKAFKITDLLNGHNMQLFIYTALLQHAGLGVGAAAFYLPAKSEMISLSFGEGDGDAEKKRVAEVRRLGVMRDEPEIINALEKGATEKDSRRLPKGSAASADNYYSAADYCVNKVKALAKQVLSGDFDSSPLGKDACEWCDFKLACHFDTTDGRHFVRRPLNFKNTEALEKMNESAGD